MLQLEMILITFTLLSSFVKNNIILKIWSKEYKVQYLDPEHSGETGESRIAYKDTEDSILTSLVLLIALKEKGYFGENI